MVLQELVIKKEFQVTSISEDGKIRWNSLVIAIGCVKLLNDE